MRNENSIYCRTRDILTLVRRVCLATLGGGRLALGCLSASCPTPPQGFMRLDDQERTTRGASAWGSRVKPPHSRPSLTVAYFLIFECLHAFVQIDLEFCTLKEFVTVLWLREAASGKFNSHSCNLPLRSTVDIVGIAVRLSSHVIRR